MNDLQRELRAQRRDVREAIAKRSAKHRSQQTRRSTKVLDREAIKAEKAKRSLRSFVEYAWPVLEPKTPFVPGIHIDAIAEHLTALYNKEIRNLVITVPPGMGKPVDIDALILMEDGSRKRLGDVVEGDKVITHTGVGRAVTAVHEQGVLPVLQVKTHAGREVKAAYDHPFLTTEGWVCTGDLKVGHVLGSVPTPKTTGSVSRSLEEFRLIGYLIGDGCTSPAADTISCLANITCFDEEEFKDIKHCIEHLGFGWSIPSKRKQQINIRGGVRPWLREVGLARKVSRTKRIPPWVFQADVNQIANLLGAYFACGGTVSRPHPGSGKWDLRVEFSSVNRPLLEDTQHLMLRLGIRARIRNKKTKYNGSYVQSYVLQVLDKDNNAKFLQCIPFYHSMKNARLAEWKPFRTKFDAPFLEDPIVSIEPVEDRECRCLTLEGEEHTFTANDLVVHNSLLSAVFFPCWVWLQEPHIRFLYSSYGQSLAYRDSDKCKILINSPWYNEHYGHIYSLRAHRKEKLETDKFGYRMASSVGGTATGERGDILCTDDPIKIEDAQSEAHRAAVIIHWDRTMSSRATSEAQVRKLIIMQRTHDADLAGQVLVEGGYVHLCLPMEYVPSKKCSTSIGWEDPRTKDKELLCPERYGINYVAEQKGKGDYSYSSLFQQNPVPEGGGLIKEGWIRYYPEHPKEMAKKASKVIQSWDMAFKDATSSSYVVGQVWARYGPNYYLLDQFRGRASFTETLEAVKRLVLLWPESREKLVEDKANGPAIIDVLSKKISGFIAVPVEGNKESRGASVSWLFEAGNVYFPDVKKHPWVVECVTEITRFPMAAYDDQFDAATQALARFMKIPMIGLALPQGVGKAGYYNQSWSK